MIVSAIYAMQRANGDWFALDEQGRFRVPLFNTHREAMQARFFNNALLVFKPVLLNPDSVETLAPGNGETSEYWLVENESTSMKRGRLMDYAQLVALVSN